MSYVSKLGPKWKGIEYVSLSDQWERFRNIVHVNNFTFHLKKMITLPKNQIFPFLMSWERHDFVCFLIWTFLIYIWNMIWHKLHYSLTLFSHSGQALFIFLICWIYNLQCIFHSLNFFLCSPYFCIQFITLLLELIFLLCTLKSKCEQKELDSLMHMIKAEHKYWK